MDPKKVYRKLYKEFGPQGWWPIGGRYVIPASAGGGSAFGGKAGIQSSSSGSPVKPGMTKAVRFEIMVGAILTQGTAWGNVEKALANLRQARALTSEAIVRMPSKRLERLIRPAGYFRQKAKKLKILAHWIASPACRQGRSSDSSLRRTLDLRRELLSLWGIGPETADSILLYAFNRPVFVVDAYTKRLCAVHGVQFETYDEYRHFFERQIDPRLYNEYHALIVAWGKKYGRPVRKTK